MVAQSEKKSRGTGMSGDVTLQMEEVDPLYLFDCGPSCTHTCGYTHTTVRADSTACFVPCFYSHLHIFIYTVYTHTQAHTTVKNIDFIKMDNASLFPPKMKPKISRIQALPMDV